MKQFYEKYLVPVAAALIAIVVIIIVTIPVEWLNSFKNICFDTYKIVITSYTVYLIYGICVGAALFIMWFMLKRYSSKKKFWCYLLIGLVFWVLHGMLPLLGSLFGVIFFKIFLNTRRILPVIGATLMVLSPVHFIKNRSTTPPQSS